MWIHWLLQISNFTRQKNLWNWCWSKVNVLTCEYIDFCLAHVTTLTEIYKMYNNCGITFNLHDKLFHRVATIVVFNNAYCLFFKVKCKRRFVANPSSIYSWSIDHILEHDFFCLGHFGCAGSKGKKSGFEEFWATFEGGFFNFLRAKNFFEKILKTF